MGACFCGLFLATLSAASVDLQTTQQFTARGYQEANPIARPFVEGRGSRGELILGSLTAAGYFAIDKTPEPWRTLVLLGGFATHTTLAVQNAKRGAASYVPPVMFPVLAIWW